MKTKIIVALLVVNSFILYSCWQQAPISSNEAINNNTTPDISAVETINQEQTIEITTDWFSPNSLTVNVWDTVSFINKDTVPRWPASGMHPTHTNYPGSSIEKCWTPEQVNIFDACKWLAQNEIFSFVFKEKWEWKYHDHLDPSKYGTIIVN